MSLLRLLGSLRYPPLRFCDAWAKQLKMHSMRRSSAFADPQQCAGALKLTCYAFFNDNRQHTPVNLATCVLRGAACIYFNDNREQIPWETLPLFCSKINNLHLTCTQALRKSFCSSSPYLVSVKQPDSISPHRMTLEPAQYLNFSRHSRLSRRKSRSWSG